MPIVDVRNQPTVVEIGPGAAVAEFTEELVTAQVLVGPTVVEFSWGELIPGPGLKGGGPFEGTVYIDQDIPGLPLSIEPLDPIEDLVMVWDESLQLHVKRPASFGGGGSLLGVDNVGTGAEIYRDTTANIAHLRTVLGEGGIIVRQDPNEVVIGIDQGIGGEFPSVGEISNSAIGCGTSIVLTPSVQLPSIAIDDLMVMIVVASGTKNSEATFAAPAGWTPFIHPRFAANHEWSNQAGVYWKFVTSADLIAATHTFTNNAGGYTICGYAFAFRNAHKQMPLMGFTYDYKSTKGWYSAPGGISSTQAVLDVLTYTEPQNVTPIFAPGYVPDIGSPWEQYYYQQFNIPGLRSWHHFIGMRHGGIFDDENMIAGETPVSCLTHPGWSSFSAAISSDRFWGNSKLYAGAGSTRHYREYPVTLFAGQKYTLAIDNFMTSFNFQGGTEGIGLGYVDPNGIERAYSFRVLNSPGQHLDPLSDLDTTWHAAVYASRYCGTPSISGNRNVLFFTAAVTGEYKIRVHHTYNSGSTTLWTHTDTANPKYINSLLLRKGWWTPNQVYTPTGAVEGASSSGRIHTWGWRPYTSFGVQAQSGRFAFSITPAGTTIPFTRLGTALGYAPTEEGNTHDYDGRTLLQSISTGENPNGSAPNYSIYPVLYNARQAYYFEIKALTAGGAPSIGITTNGMGGGSHARAVWHLNNNLLYWHDGTSSTPTGGSAVAVNDVFGCKIDFRDVANIVVTFYRNGTSVGTKSVACSTNGYLDPNEAWTAYFLTVYGYPTSAMKLITALSTGQMAYMPTDGTLPYDALGAQPDVPFTGITASGVGTSLVTGTATAPKIKSLLAGLNVDITSSLDEVTIGALGGAIFLRGVVTDTTVGSPTPFLPAGMSTIGTIRWNGASALTLYTMGETFWYEPAITDKKLVYLANVTSAQTITIKHNASVGGFNSHQFLLPNNRDLVIPPYGGVWLYYNLALARWQAIAQNYSGGLQAIYIPASKMTPSAVGGCAALATIASAALQPDIQSLDFDTTTQEFAQFSIRMPKRWNLGGVSFIPVWSHAATTTNFGVVWQLQGVATSNDDAIAAAYGTPIISTDTGGTTNDLYVGPESGFITIAGTPAVEDVVHFQVSRVPANGGDTLAIDARLHGITVYIGTTASNDS